MRVGAILGAVNSRIILAAVFYAVVTPVGLTLRCLRKDPISRRMDRAASSYRISSRTFSAKQMEKPF
jgi:hypothetical protein